MTNKIIFPRQPVRCALAVVALAILAGCNRDVPPPPPVNVAPAPPQQAAAPVVVAAAPMVVADDNYVYYPDYEVYYSPADRVYWYRQGDAWASGPAAPGISAQVLLAAPSVRMNFHDAPANHHAAVVQQYPRGWRPSDAGRR
jgi:hypothetical protein